MDFFQLVYNTNNPLHFFSQNLALVLGTWHPYKLCSENIYQKFLHTFLGPAFHTLFPTSAIKVKPRLSQLEHFFSLLSRAYPLFRQELMLAVLHMDTQQRFYSDLWNLFDIFEFFLPLVCNFFCFLSFF